MTKADGKRGYNKAVELMRGDTYMYDSSRRIYELQKLDPHYESQSDDYKRGFMQAVYDYFRC